MAEAHRRQVRRPVTRADVARYAGVSTAVVSYVMNDGPKPVAAATAARVRRAIEVLGYRPNLSARALRSGSTRMLALVVSDISNPFFADYALQVQAEAGSRGYAVLMANAHGDPAMESQIVDDLIDRIMDDPGLNANPKVNEAPPRSGNHPAGRGSGLARKELGATPRSTA